MDLNVKEIDLNMKQFAFGLGKAKIEFPNDFHCVTVYYNPKDYPNKYVARLYIVIKKEMTHTRLFTVQDKFDDIHKGMPVNFDWIDRNENDDPVIVGTYI